MIKRKQLPSTTDKFTNPFPKNVKLYQSASEDYLFYGWIQTTRGLVWWFWRILQAKTKNNKLTSIERDYSFKNWYDIKWINRFGRTEFREPWKSTIVLECKFPWTEKNVKNDI